MGRAERGEEEVHGVDPAIGTSWNKKNQVTGGEEAPHMGSCVHQSHEHTQ